MMTIFPNAARTPRLIARWLGLLFLLYGAVLPATAQFDTGSVNGTVVDSTGAVIPHASVTVHNTGTGAVIPVTANDAGAFTAPDLPSGIYTVSASAPGFSSANSQSIVLNVGAAVHVTLRLAAAGVSETVTVTGTETSVNTENTAAGETFNSEQITNLPVNGRDVSGFLEVSPGSVASSGYFQGSVNGLENIFSGLNITVDGQSANRGDINGFLMTEGQEASHVTRASIDSIQEIDFSNNGYTAETGHSLGPQMNIITKGGTNEFHGNVFEFLRNDAFDAHDYFETQHKQPLKLNQFGANLAGPLVRNQLFFFANYEGDREHLTVLSPLNHTLSAYARSKFVSSMQPILAQLMPLPAGCAAIPAPTSCSYPGSDSGTAGGANMVYAPATLPTILREDTGSARVDWNLSPNDRVFVRYNINDSLTNDTYGPNLGQVSPQALTTQLVKADYTHIFSSTLLNQFSVAVNRFFSNTASNTPKPYYSVSGFFTDLGALPGANSFNQVNAYSTYELFENLTKVLHNNNLKAGFQLRVNRQNEALSPNQAYYYASFSDLESNNPFVLAKNGFNGSVGIYNSNWDWYVQDNWHITRKLVLNAGLRYEYNTVWREKHNQMVNFDIPTQSFDSATEAPYSAPRADFQPRIGLSYDPFGTGKTVFHAYGGLFVLPMWLSYGLVTNLPQYESYNVNVFDALFGGYSISFPSPNPPMQAGTQVVSSFPKHPHDPTATNWLFGVEQELPAHVVMTINYNANRVQHQQAGVNFAAVNANPLNAVTAIPQVYSGFSSENYDADTLGSNYNSLQVQLRRNYGSLNTEVNYAWSHEIDDMVNVFSQFSDPFNPRLDRASGDIDVRHNFTASAVYNLPALTHATLLKKQALGGWQMSSILQTRSALPENVTLISGFFGLPMRPNLVSGQSPYLSSIRWPTQSYNINAFSVPAGYDGTWGKNLGNVGRNTLRGPAFFQWDFSTMKNFPLNERMKFQFRADLFNILNHPNFTNPDGGICQAVFAATSTSPASCIPNPNFGVTAQTIQAASGGQIGNGTSRQVQFSMKLIF